MNAGQQALVAKLTKNESPEDALIIEAVVGQVFEALESLNRIATALEKMAAFKGIE